LDARITLTMKRLEARTTRTGKRLEFRPALAKKRLEVRTTAAKRGCSQEPIKQGGSNAYRYKENAPPCKKNMRRIMIRILPMKRVKYKRRGGGGV
jgi:hypothetical protein